MLSRRASGPVAALLIGLLAASVAFAQSNPRQAVRLDGGSAALDGPWQFHLGDDPAWAAPGYDDSRWEQLRTDAAWGRQGHPNTEGFGWYRLHVELPPNGAPQQLVLYVPIVEDAYEVYWNGRLVGGYGKLPANPAWPFFPVPQRFSLGPAVPGVLAVRAWKAPFNSFDSGLAGGIPIPPVLGSPQAVDAVFYAGYYHYLQGRQVEFGIATVYGLVALLALVGWLRDRRIGLALWMACFASVQPLIQLLLALRTSSTVGSGVEGLIYAMGDVSLWFLLVWLLELRSPRMMRLTAILGACNIGIMSVDLVLINRFAAANPHPWQIADLALMPVLNSLELYPFVLIGMAVKQRIRLGMGRWLVAILAFLTQTITMAGWALEQGRRYTHWTAGEWLQRPLFTVAHNDVSKQETTGGLLLLALVYAVYRYSVDARRDQTRLEEEIRNARVVQQVLIPEALPTVPGFEVESLYHPASEVGGDFFQILATGTGGVLVVIGDVSGKGMPAAMTVSLLVGTVRTLAHFSESPAQILSAMNQRMLGRSQGGFTTCLVLRVDADGSVTAANAGHLAPYLDGREMPLDTALPLGLSAEAVYSEETAQLAPESQITLMTDGVVEARSAAGELFGFDRAAALSSQTADEVARAAQEFGQEDDITVLTLRRVPVSAVAHATAPMALSPDPA